MVGEIWPMGHSLLTQPLKVLTQGIQFAFSEATLAYVKRLDWRAWCLQRAQPSPVAYPQEGVGPFLLSCPAVFFEGAG